MPENETTDFKILRQGDNCWRVEKANRLAPLIDMSAYLEALTSACELAEKYIFIIGWDFDRHEPAGRGEGTPTLESFLHGLLERNRGLHIFLLIWDYSMIYAAEREWFQSWKLRFNGHRRLHVQFDNEHPLGGSQHQKLVVIDDALAFCGGIDLSRWRWDTPEHRAEDTRRIDPDGDSYPPFHDVMWALDDDAASALGQLARTRWRWSGSDESLPATPSSRRRPWPAGLEPLFENIPVAIARTFPAYRDRSEIREVEQLFVDSIARAQNYIYVENQYLTSRVITAALAERLEQDDPPEVMLVLPHHTGGWLEQVTMDMLRCTQLQKLRTADRQQRLRVYYPDQPGLPKGECISVHAKLMIIDDYFLHSGSANTSDRSLGLDSECDIALEAQGHDGVAWLLHRLLSEHLGCSLDEMRRARDECGTLAAAVERLRRPGERTLLELETAETQAHNELSQEADLLDPQEPINPDYFVHRAIPRKHAPEGRRRLLVFLGFIGFLLVCAAAWRWTPLADWATTERLTRALQWLGDPLTKSMAVLAVVVVASLLMVPLTLLVVASAVLLGPWIGFGCSMAGALLSAWVAFQLGNRLGGSAIRGLSGSDVQRLSKSLSDRGVLAIAVLRMLPVAPYTVVNLAAGASHLQAGKFMLGSLLGLAPGIAALTVFSGSLFEAVMDPSAGNLGILAVVACVIIAGILLFRRLLKSS
jgi:phospholipase D1/2